MTQSDGRRRVVVEGVSPEVDCGRFPIKRIVGDTVTVEADVFADGHDVVVAALAFRHDRPVKGTAKGTGKGRGGGRDDRAGGEWTEVPMQPLGNDRWRATFTVEAMGRYTYQVRGWVDHFATWWDGYRKKVEAQALQPVDILVGAELVESASKRATGADADALRGWADDLRYGGPVHGVNGHLIALASRYADTSLQGQSDELGVVVDRPLARFGAWYEMFPRSAAADQGRHGTFADVERRLAYVAGMGFDVLYLPPIHPIGTTHRKGRNNSVESGAGDPGSPWAIGGAEGGHKAIHPDLGTLEDFDRLVAAARALGMEVAIDFAIQASPDHPWVRKHPEWFRNRPDGTLQYAENPPKRYQDIYPLDFETEDWRGLWWALREVVEFWMAHGVRFFRVDNPHTKAFAFWEWLIDGIKAEHPDVLFLAEAFTRPRVMHRLAKLGFSQSYTYFTWRTTKAELTDYATELTAAPVREFFRPNFWPNTPDILAMQLQSGGRPSFIARLILAATLVGSYGIYGPPFEMGEDTPVAPGSEEYLHSEKYEIRTWDLDRPDSLTEVIATVNAIRRAHPALQGAAAPRFVPVDNDSLIAYTKATADDAVLVVVNLDARWPQSGWVDLPLAELGLADGPPYDVVDLLTGARFAWSGGRNYVRLDPAAMPAHILELHPPPTPAHGA